jgi:hypothetical protein
MALGYTFYRSSKNLGTPHTQTAASSRPRRQGGEDRSDMTTLLSCWTLYRKQTPRGSGGSREGHARDTYGERAHTAQCSKPMRLLHEY